MTEARYSGLRDEDLVNSAEVRRMFAGVSEMTIWRWTRSESVQFPKPITISGKNYWYIGDLRRFRERCASRFDANVAASAAARLQRGRKTVADAASTERAAS